MAKHDIKPTSDCAIFSSRPLAKCPKMEYALGLFTFFNVFSEQIILDRLYVAYSFKTT